MAGQLFITDMSIRVIRVDDEEYRAAIRVTRKRIFLDAGVTGNQLGKIFILNKDGWIWIKHE